MTAPETQFTAIPGSLDMISTAVLDAPVEAVYRAHTEQDAFTRWWGPSELTAKVEAFEPRAGGSWRIVQVDPGGGEYAFNGVFHLVTPTRIVKTFEFEGVPGHVSLQTTTFEDVGGKTRVTDHAVFQTVEDRDGMKDTGAEQFAPVGMAQLEEVAKTL